MNTKDNDALGNLKSLIWKYVCNVCVFRSDWVKSFYSSKLQRSGSTTSKSTFISSVSRVSPPVLQLQLLTAPISRPNCNNLLPRRRHEPHAVPLPHNSPTHLPAEKNLFGRKPRAHHPTKPQSKLHCGAETSPDTIIKETGCSFLKFFSN